MQERERRRRGPLTPLERGIWLGRSASWGVVGLLSLGVTGRLSRLSGVGGRTDERTDECGLASWPRGFAVAWEDEPLKQLKFNKFNTRIENFYNNFENLSFLEIAPLESFTDWFICNVGLFWRSFRDVFWTFVYLFSEVLVQLSERNFNEKSH